MIRIKFLEKYLDKETISGILRDIPESKQKLFAKHLDKAYQAELARIPKIAFIGRTGVGKTSTLNALFGTNRRVRHTRPATKRPTNWITDEGSNGKLQFIDMPGVGEDIDLDDKYIRLYQEVLTDCDVAVWIISEDDRDLAYDQWFIQNFRDDSNLGLASRLVIGINKIDRIHPGNWNYRFNIPSKEQEHYISARTLYVQEKFQKIYPKLSYDRIVAYSAKFHYHLYDLFGAMLDASPSRRALALNNVKAIGSILDKVDKRVLKDPQISQAVSQILGVDHVRTR